MQPAVSSTDFIWVAFYEICDFVCFRFAIIMTEVISREEPYSNEVVNLTVEEIVQLVRDKNAPSAAKAKRVW